jgi:hypothetical protein
METRGYWKLKKEALYHALWITRFGRPYVLVARLRDDNDDDDVCNDLLDGYYKMIRDMHGKWAGIA